MLTLCGVQLVPFSPLHDKQLPPGLSAVLLGGGPVQDWLGQLSANSSMLQALRAFAAAGGLVVGEGAGLMYLSQSVQRPGQQMRYAMGKSQGSASTDVTARVGMCLCTSSQAERVLVTHKHVSRVLMSQLLRFAASSQLACFHSTLS